MQEFEKYLQEELSKLQLLEYLDDFKKYLLCLLQWNKAYNLTAVREPVEIIARHFIESLQIAPWLKGDVWLDVGTGPGFPGMPLAITHPNKKIFLLDSNIKKINFLREIKRQLKLEHVTVIYSHTSDFHPKLYFDTVMSRALSSLTQFVNWTEHLVGEDGIWLAMKGKNPTEEIQQLKTMHPKINYQYIDTKSASSHADRCLIIMQRTARHE
jgi:16S rRNA (guanine527-N7)-methyltransferase